MRKRLLLLLSLLLGCTFGPNEPEENVLTKRVEIHQFQRGTHYFLDEYYRQQYGLRTDPGMPIVFQPHFVIDLKLYKSAPDFQQYAEAFRAWAFAPNAENKINFNDLNTRIFAGDTSTVDPNHYVGYFIALQESTDFVLNDKQGYVRLLQPLQEGEVLAVAFKDLNYNERGQVNYTPESHATAFLRLLKAPNSHPQSDAWDMEWKNIYATGWQNFEPRQLSVSIYYNPPDGEAQTICDIGPGEGLPYLQILGLDRRNSAGQAQPDGHIDRVIYTVNPEYGEVYFPDLQPFDPIYEENQQLLPVERRVPVLYESTDTQLLQSQNQFYIEFQLRR